MNTFPEWLLEQMDERGWKQADLARAANLDTAVISNIINRKRKAGEVVCSAIARGLNLPPETVFRIAGLLPPAPVNQPPDLLQIIQLYLEISEEAREELLNYAKFRAETERKKKSAKRHKTHLVDLVD